MKNLMFLLFASLLVLSACGMSEENKEKKFSEASQKYVEDISKTFEKVDNSKSEKPKEISKEANQASIEINKAYKTYKKEVGGKLIKDNYDRKELDKTFEQINEIYSDFYMRVDKVGSINNITKEAFYKIIAKDIYITNASLENLKENIQTVDTRGILGKKQNNNLQDTLHTKESEQEELIITFATMQNNNLVVDDTSKIPKRDMLKLNKYANNLHNRTISATEFNELVDNVNKSLDKDSQIGHVEDEVNVYVYNIVMDINNALTDVHNEEEMTKYDTGEDESETDITSPETEELNLESEESIEGSNGDSNSEQDAREAELEKEYFELSDKMYEDGITDAEYKSMEQRQNEILEEIEPID